MWESTVCPEAATQTSKPGYFRSSLLVRTLNLTVGRFAVEASRVLLRRRRRSRRASVEKKCRPTHAIVITARTPKMMSATGLSKYMELYLTHPLAM